MNAFSGNGEGGLTAAANTAIEFLVPPNRQGVTRLSRLSYTAGATAHTLRVQRPLATALVSGPAAAGQAVVPLKSIPNVTGNNLAANDRLAIRSDSDGITRIYTVSSVSGLNVTLSSNLAVALQLNDKVWNMGVTGDTDPVSGRAFPAFGLAASATTIYEDREAGFCASWKRDEPLLVSSNNATNAGTINQLSWTYTIN